ncbi:MAG: DUF6064 family protein [Acidobacteriota bacterium]
MNLPFSADQFFSIFETYNRAIFPVQVIAYALGGVAVLMALSKFSKRDQLVAAILAAFWLWTGIFYHLMYFSSLNPAAYIFGLVFIIQGGLLLWFGFVKQQLSFSFSRNLRSLVGGLLILYAMALYPALGYVFDHGYPQSPMFGVTPCPLTIFTLGFFLFVQKKVPWQLLIIPLLWSLVGSTAAFLFGVKEDFGLLVAGLLVLAFVFESRREKILARL